MAGISKGQLRIWAPVSRSAGVLLFVIGYAACAAAAGQRQGLQISVGQSDGSYSIGDSGAGLSIIKSGVDVELDGQWVHSSDYPKRTITQSTITDDLGSAHEWTVTFSGLADKPDILYHLRAYPDRPVGDIQAIVHNGTSRPVHVEAIRAIAASGTSLIDLGGPALQDRVLSDSFSEDRPGIKIHDLADAKDQMHRGVGSQLIYNRQSRRSFFVGALTSDRFLTVLRLHLTGATDAPHIASYEVDSTGTTELLKDYSLRQSPAEDQLPLDLEVAPGSDLASERLLFSLDNDYHRQLEMYGSLIKQLHHARVTSPTLLGWWSWIPYYFGLNAGAALTEAQWLDQHLKSLGYNYFVMDEGYQYARGEYSTSDAALFPHGVGDLESKVRGLGLVPGIWTAPFEVSDRSWVYQNHPDWLVHNKDGKPIHAGWAVDHHDQLYALDTTNPGAQDYLRQTYSTLVHEWGIRYIKMDFMEDSGVEGYFYRPNTTAMEAQRIGWEVIRQAVGNDVLLDKDGCEMLNPVGYFDSGRVSVDTADDFNATRAAASGIAARYYMNRNFYVTDPDAFSVSLQTTNERSDNPRHPITLDEAKASIVLAAVSGGLFEIGDSLPPLGAEPERLALVTNKDLIAMAQLGRSSVPMDLLTYLAEDQQPSLFLLKEDGRQAILTIFNWTDNPRSHTISLSDLGLSGDKKYSISDVLDNGKTVRSSSNSLVVDQPAHSVRVLKIIDNSVPAAGPTVRAEHPSEATAGETIEFTARSGGAEIAAISYEWNFGDGIQLKGSQVNHAYTRPGKYQVTVTVTGLEGLTGEDSFLLPVTGSMSTQFHPTEKKRYQPQP
jgi:alpha-galactosidase